ncbi:hypothetical protein FHR83_003151 [Actinoplanes campanulatus]|uniref:Uncharacterized protein n=1 Tax=Actinoplanes campanulatus TaxID=113559 RepID=A0A7W5AG88_9ACTN|nr:hypothetical protein [Actinoplanes campanulatus]MBB3095481.1 hypothetical protein [Actinoplanes campanulatus]
MDMPRQANRPTAAPARAAADAARSTAPLLFHLPDDEVFPVDGQREPFNLIRSIRRCLVTEPGRHVGTTPRRSSGGEPSSPSA